MAEGSGTSSAGGTSTKKEGPLHVKELGLTQIDGRSEDYPFIADVVFVHGLQGHPQRTWQSKSPRKPGKRLQDRLKSFSLSGSKDLKVEAQDVAKPFWPAELLPRDFENVRIFTYGYDSKVTKAFTAPTSKNGIFQHGNSLLRALSRVRLKCSGRPIIFVAHSLGYVHLEALDHNQIPITRRFESKKPTVLPKFRPTMQTPTPKLQNGSVPGSRTC